MLGGVYGNKCSKYEYVGGSRRHLPLILVKEVYLDINERSQVFVLFLGLKILSSQRILWFTHVFLLHPFLFYASPFICSGKFWIPEQPAYICWTLEQRPDEMMLKHLNSEDDKFDRQCNGTHYQTKIGKAFDLCPNSLTSLALMLEFHKCKK